MLLRYISVAVLSFLPPVQDRAVRIDFFCYFSNKEIYPAFPLLHRQSGINSAASGYKGGEGTDL
jgi:hypothetical protein